MAWQITVSAVVWLSKLHFLSNTVKYFALSLVLPFNCYWHFLFGWNFSLGGEIFGPQEARPLENPDTASHFSASSVKKILVRGENWLLKITVTSHASYFTYTPSELYRRIDSDRFLVHYIALRYIIRCRRHTISCAELNVNGLRNFRLNGSHVWRFPIGKRFGIFFTDKRYQFAVWWRVYRLQCKYES